MVNKQLRHTLYLFKTSEVVTTAESERIHRNGSRHIQSYNPGILLKGMRHLLELCKHIFSTV